MYATTDSSVVNAKLAGGFVAVSKDVEVKTDGSILFKNANRTSIDNNGHVAKDYSAVSTLRLEGSKNTKVEFDIKIDSFGEGDKGLLGMTLRETGALAYKFARSFLIGKTQFGFSGWEFSGYMGNAALGAPKNIPEGIDMSDGATHHVIVERVGGVGYRIILDGNADAAVWSYDNYADDMLISFCGTTVAGTISNITIADL